MIHAKYPTEANVLIVAPTVRVSGEFKKIMAIAFRTAYEHKETIAAFVKARGGSWYTIDKYWYCPIDTLGQGWEILLQAIAEIPEVFGSAISIATEITGDGGKRINAFIAKKTKEFNAREQVRECFEVFPEASDYVSHPDFVFHGEEIAQKQAIVTLADGQQQRVIVFDRQPKDLSERDATEEILSGGHYRQYSLDGESRWCMPWTNPRDRHEIGAWLDTVRDLIEDALENPDTPEFQAPEAPIGAQISVRSKDKNPTWFAISICGGESFNRWLSWCKRWEGRKWDGDKKVWLVPIGEDSIDSLRRNAADRSWYGRTELSEGAREILESAGVENL
jgi:hypothetical protein